MNQDYWQKQTTGQPLFPNILWSKPETKRGAGKILVIGGQAEEFVHVAECYAEAEKAGAGTVRVIMPDSTAKVTRMLPNIEYAPANSSGSFSKQALAELLDVAQWADGVLLAGDIGKNSETNLMLENFISKYEGCLVISADAFQSITLNTPELFERENTTLVADLVILQKLLKEIKHDKALTSGTGDVGTSEILHEITTKFGINISLIFRGQSWSARKGRVASTKLTASPGAVAARTAAWLIQQPNKQFEAMASAAYELLP